MKEPFHPRRLVPAVVLLLVLPGGAIPATASLDGACAVAPDPYLIPLLPTPHANEARGVARLRFAESPFGLAIEPDGTPRFEIQVRTENLPTDGRSLVAWAASPELDVVHRLGVLDAEGDLDAQVSLTKFLVFVTAEPHPEVARWSGPILLRGISRSGRMHSMVGHGPFEGEPCE